ncbi:MAG: DUF1080 domain-containing protein [Bryobacterales bacterium]|nr:DUF1080 domain-containing protein [Bryobacterales bacterium]
MKRREFLSVPMAVAVAHAKSGWVSLCDGKTLKGWKQAGHAHWDMKDGAIAGRQGAGGAAGDLLTEQQWKDFEAELEWSMKWPGNSGIWFRYSNPDSAYQADILDQASHPGVLSGSLYCAGKMFIAENRDAASVNKDGWNRMRIRAQGDEITIEQNGRRVIRMRDKTFAGPGSIGIQLHAGKAFEGMEIRVRKLRVRSLD